MPFANARALKGQFFEALTVLYFLVKGYIPVQRNQRQYGAEVDILVRKGHALVLVEVKFRATFEAALYGVHPKQYQRLKTRQQNLQQAFSKHDVRLDYVLWSKEFPYIRHLKQQ